jgi:hypothetical protein
VNWCTVLLKVPITKISIKKHAPFNIVCAYGQIQTEEMLTAAVISGTEMCSSYQARLYFNTLSTAF